MKEHLVESLNQLICVAQSETHEFYTKEQLDFEVELIKQSILNLIKDAIQEKTA